MVSLFKEFHSFEILLLFFQIFFIKGNIKFADWVLKKDSPKIIKGFFEFKIFFEISFLPSKIFN